MDFKLIEKLEDYEINEAEKLLRSIKLISNMEKIRVQKPNSNGLEYITLSTWIEWFCENFMISGEMGYEREVLAVLQQIEMNNERITRRIEDGFRKLLNVIERRKTLTDELLKNVNQIEDEPILPPPDAKKEEPKEEEEEMPTDAEILRGKLPTKMTAAFIKRVQELTMNTKAKKKKVKK